MGKRIKLPDFDYAKIGNTIGQATKKAAEFVSDHTPEFLAGALTVVGLDNLRVRLCRKQDQEAFKESSAKQQAILRKHEAEINVLKSEAEQMQEAKQTIELLKHIVNDDTKGGASE